MTLPEAEALLEASCEATRSLYLFMLDIIPYLTAEARTRIENARNKFNPSEEERNPNMKFVCNAVSPLNPDKGIFQGIYGFGRDFGGGGHEAVHKDIRRRVR